MNLGEMKTLVRVYVDDRNSELFQNSEIVCLINAAQSRIAKIIEMADEKFFSGIETYEISPDTDAYEVDLPADFVRILLAETTDTTPPTPCTWVDFVQRHETPALDTGGHRVYLRGIKLGVVAPLAAVTLKVWYAKRLPDFVEGSDTTTSEIPAHWHDLICLEAAKRGYGSREKEMPRDLDMLLQQGLTELTLEVEQRQRQQPKFTNYIEDQ